MGFPSQQQNKPGIESLMTPRPVFDNPNYKASGKLMNKVALITGGDSGIGRAIAVAFAKEGADIAISYLDEHSDAEETKEYVNKHGRRCTLIPGDIGYAQPRQEAVMQTVEEFGRIDILVNNAGVMHVKDDMLDVDSKQRADTFHTNIFSQFILTSAALPYMNSGSCIINTTSIDAYQGAKDSVDVAAANGAIVSFTRSLSLNLAEKGIRVNGVAPGTIWTPLIPSYLPAEQIPTFGDNVPMKRAGQPFEVAPAYVFLASDDASYMSGQILHVNGGVIVNS
ncbi:SDR family oxidoreductase [Paenibacillus sp. 5J-6]|uniref:SDR family oxidoreductase n=1 Tax=Paenibacillus silvestris TaxID=2606219 RepID=A0A6L8V6D8_9BACL|nr:SDR family oxidoreductase [Paenibacillus silvestris]MZQ84820.1 SDR family oxidoreductase [Paenibacillus silvestris]